MPDVDPIRVVDELTEVLSDVFEDMAGDIADVLDEGEIDEHSRERLAFVCRSASHMAAVYGAGDGPVAAEA